MPATESCLVAHTSTPRQPKPSIAPEPRRLQARQAKRRTEKYRKAHPERVNAKSRRFYARHKDEPEFKARKREYGRRYRQAHHDERLAYERKRRALHREEIREYMRQWKIAHSTGKIQFACKAYTITLHDQKRK